MIEKNTRKRGKGRFFRGYRFLLGEFDDRSTIVYSVILCLADFPTSFRFVRNTTIRFRFVIVCRASSRPLLGAAPRDR